MKIEPKIQAITIVLVGDFNPKIFQPFWFETQKIIRKSEAESAKVNIIHPDITDFNLDWLNIQVSREKFIANSVKEPYFTNLFDFVVSTFKYLEHTPIRMLGINRDMHFQLETKEEWHEFGHKITPKSIWNGIIDSPGLRSITMEGDVNRKGLNGYIRVTCEPSSRVNPNGILFKVNDHYQVKDEKILGCSEIILILEKEYSESINRSNSIIYSLLEKAMK